MKKVITLILVVLVLSARAQFNYTPDASTRVLVAGEEVPFPWTGGLNGGQFNTMDLNFDGKDDLVMYDRTAEKLITFLHVENSWQYAPEYEEFFPAEVTNWVMLRDFDCDGLKDLFTGNILGIRVFRNESTSNTLVWKPFYFYVGTSRSEVLITKALSGKINLQLQFDDLPSFTDVDRDGDLDIFTIDYGGAGTVELHKNFSMERYEKCDSLDFELVTKKWGGFTECDCADFAFNNEGCSTSGGRVKHQGGKSLLAIDTDSDSEYEMLLSEAECDKLSLMVNEGSSTAPVVNESILFPTPPATFSFYPTPYFEDADFDGVRDLIVSPNLFSKPEPEVNFKSSTWFYRNTGTDEAPDFSFVKNDFLQEDMIDLGDNAVPAFADMDGDGDFDLFVSTNHYPSTITVFENTGSRTVPEFTMRSEDYLNLSARLYRNLKIQLVDVNRDGRTDLVFSATLPDNAGTKLFYVANNATGRLDFGAAVPELIQFSMTGPENLHLTDVNSDGQVDILRGRSNGVLEYWRNTGSLTFTLEDGQFLGIGSNVLRPNPGAWSADLNLDGKTDLIVTDFSGKLKLISNYKSATVEDATTDIVLNALTGEYYSPNLGGRVWATSAEVFGNGAHALMIGTTLGGLRFLRPAGDFSGEPSVSIYPNPVKQTEDVTITVNQVGSMKIYSATGQLVRPDRPLQAGVVNMLDMDTFAQGVYILRFSVGNKSFSRRLVVH